MEIISLITNNWKVGLILSLLVSSFYFGYDYRGGIEATAKLELEAKLKKEFKTKQDKVNEANQTQLTELQTINGNLLNDINGLRNRASRRANESKPTCQGASGANLSREDSEFLVGEAARADTIRSGLKTCYEYVDTVSK